MRLFEQEAVYPLLNGKYAIKKEVVSANEEIRKMFSIEDTRELLGNDNLHYLANPQNRGLHFIRENNVKILEAKILLESLLCSEPEDINALFANRKPEWYEKVYTLLAPVRDNFDLEPLSECDIVYTQSGKLIRPSEAKFVDDATIILDKRFEEVSKTVYGQGDSSKSKARLFLEAIGVEVFTKNDAQAIKNEHKRDNLQHKLESLTEKDDIIAITKSVIAYVESNKNRELTLNLNVPFVLNKSGKLVKPSECYLDLPYLETGFSCAEHIHHKEMLSDIYIIRLSEDELRDFEKLLRDFNILYAFKIVSTDNLKNHKDYKELTNRPNDVQRITYDIQGDWIIDDLAAYLALHNHNIALGVWTAIMKERPYNSHYVECDKTVAYKQWQYNRNAITRASSVVHILHDTAWLPDIDGNYRKPSELSPDTLDKDFHIDSNSPFLDAIEFGKEENERRKQLEEEERHRSSEYQRKESAANVFGYDADTLEDKLRKAELYERAEAEGRIAPEIQIEEPTANTKHPEKRMTAAIEDTNNASNRTYEQKSRSVRLSKIKNEATTMLRTLYTNNEDKMICQCCGKELPFKKKNGEYYFETVELDNRGGEFFTKETRYPYIACCPNCAAMFNEHIVNCSTNENRIADLLNKIETNATIKKPNGNEVIEIIMDGKIFNLTFVQKHIVDIRAALTAEKK